MENALYYTLSTIAQTLAGALAVLVAVVLFNLTKVDNAINAAASIGLPGPKALRAALRAGVSHSGERITAERADKAWQVRLRLTTALWFTVADIALCFLALPVTPWIGRSPWATGVVLALVVTLGVFCLLLYVWLIAAMAGLPAQ